MIKKVFSSMMIIFFCAGVATAADQLRTRNPVKDQKMLKDGSCRMLENDAADSILAAAANQNGKRNLNRNQNRNRFKTGTLESALFNGHSVLMAADQSRTRDRAQEKDQLKDGSCQD